MTSRGSSTGSFLALWCCISIMAPRAAGDITTLGSSKDNTLYEDAGGSRSNGAGTAMFAGRNSQATDSIRRAVISFDVAGALPAGATIDGVTLELSNSAANIGDQTLGIHRLLGDWGEGPSAAGGGGGSGGPAAPGDATWLHTFYDTDLWTTPGGDFDSVISAATIVGGPGTYTWASTAQLIADVQLFLDDPALNFGWIMLGNENEPGTAKKFATREESDPALQPVLTVDYTPVPEPRTLAMLLAAVLPALVGRRRVRRGTMNDIDANGGARTNVLKR